MTRARVSFRRSIRRCRHLLDVHRGAYGAKGVSVLALRDLPIEAATLAVSAYRTYVSDVLAEVMIARCEAPLADGEDVQVLRTVLTEPGLAAEIASLDMQRPDEVRRVIREHFRATLTADGAVRIRAAMGRVGIVDQPPAERSSDGHIEAFGGEVDRWVETCDRIARQPDPVSIRRDEAEACSRLIAEVVEQIDAVAQRLVGDARTPAGIAAR